MVKIKMRPPEEVCIDGEQLAEMLGMGELYRESKAYNEAHERTKAPLDCINQPD